MESLLDPLIRRRPQPIGGPMPPIALGGDARPSPIGGPQPPVQIGHGGGGAMPVERPLPTPIPMPSNGQSHGIEGAMPGQRQGQQPGGPSQNAINGTPMPGPVPGLIGPPESVGDGTRADLLSGPQGIRGPMVSSPYGDDMHGGPVPSPPGADYDLLHGAGGPQPVQPAGSQTTLPGAPGPGWVNINGGWVPANHPLATGGGDHPGTGGTGPVDANGNPTNLEDAVRKRLLDLLNTDPTKVSLNDPALKGQSEAFAVGQARSAQRQREMLAERRAAEGSGSSGAFDADLTNLAEQQGESEQQFNAQLIGNELQNRRAMLMSALEQGAGMLNAEQQRAAQIEIANIDAAVRRLGIETQGQLGVGQLNLGLLQTLMQNQQFNDNLGANLGMFQWNANNPWHSFGFG